MPMSVRSHLGSADHPDLPLRGSGDGLACSVLWGLRDNRPIPPSS